MGEGMNESKRKSGYYWVIWSDWGSYKPQPQKIVAEFYDGTTREGETTPEWNVPGSDCPIGLKDEKKFFLKIASEPIAEPDEIK